MDEPSPVQKNDADLALRLMEGEDDAFRELIRTHGPKVKGHLQARFPGHVADDAWCEALRKVWKYALQYDESKGSLGTWFLAIAHRCALDICRRARRKDDEELPDDYPYVPPDSDEPSDDATTKKERQRRQQYIAAVREIMQGMTDLQRAVIEADLAYLTGDVPHDAVAPADELVQSLNKAKNNIYKIRHDARAKLRKEMERRGFYPEGPKP